MPQDPYRKERWAVAIYFPSSFEVFSKTYLGFSLENLVRSPSIRNYEKTIFGIICIFRRLDYGCDFLKTTGKLEENKKITKPREKNIGPWLREKFLEPKTPSHNRFKNVTQCPSIPSPSNGSPSKDFDGSWTGQLFTACSQCHEPATSWSFTSWFLCNHGTVNILSNVRGSCWWQS